MEVGEIFLRQEDGNTLRLVLHRGSERGTACGGEASTARRRYWSGRSAKTGQPRVVEPALQRARDLRPGSGRTASTRWSCFPLTGRRGVLGVLCVASSQTQPLDELEMQFLSTISAWVGTVIENVRLNVQQRRLAVLEERERIGMDLHDGIIQSIYAVGLTLEHARLLLNEAPEQAHQRIEQAISDLNSTIRDIRAYILDLRPRQLHDENLMQGLQRLVNEFRANTLVEVNLEGPPMGRSSCPSRRPLRSSTSARRRWPISPSMPAPARWRWCCGPPPTACCWKFSDDGRGFDQPKVKLTLGHGLSNMQTRAHNVGGDVEITSEPGKRHHHPGLGARQRITQMND